MWRVGRASDEEGLRLILAFFNIDDPGRRRQLIELAETFARESHPGYSHEEITAVADVDHAHSLMQDNERTAPRKP